MWVSHFQTKEYDCADARAWLNAQVDHRDKVDGSKLAANSLRDSIQRKELSGQLSRHNPNNYPRYPEQAKISRRRQRYNALPCKQIASRASATSAYDQSLLLILCRQTSSLVLDKYPGDNNVH